MKWVGAVIVFVIGIVILRVEWQRSFRGQRRTKTVPQRPESLQVVKTTIRGLAMKKATG